MYEDAQEIFDFLPIRRIAPENDYINHLWEVFLALDTNETAVRSFTVMPFHLLFMLAIQYKIFRISLEKKQEYELACIMSGGRNRDEILKPESVFEIALINERTIPEIFKVVSASVEDIKQIKELIDNRNDNLAHAKGGIEPDPEKKIEEYLVSLRNIQKYMLPLNDAIATKWLSEITPEDVDGLDEFIEVRLPRSYLCLADLRSGLLKDYQKTLGAEK